MTKVEKTPHKRAARGLGLKHDTKPVCTKLPPDVDAVLRELPNRSDFIRDAIREKMEREGLF